MARARERLPEKTEEPRPKGQSLAMATASSSLPNLTTARRGQGRSSTGAADVGASAQAHWQGGRQGRAGFKPAPTPTDFQQKPNSRFEVLPHLPSQDQTPPPARCASPG